MNIAGIDQEGGKSVTYLGTGFGLTDTYDGGAGMDKFQATESNLTLVVKTIENVTYDSVEEIDGSIATNFRVRILDNTVQDFTKVKLTNVMIDLGDGDDMVIGSSANPFVDTNADGTADAYNDASGNDRRKFGSQVKLSEFEWASMVEPGDEHSASAAARGRLPGRHSMAP